MRETKNGKELLVKWKGYTDDFNTWETLLSIKELKPDLVYNFLGEKYNPKSKTKTKKRNAKSKAKRKARKSVSEIGLL